MRPKDLLASLLAVPGAETNPPGKMLVVPGPLVAAGCKPAEIMKRTNISRASFYRIAKAA
jgi:hypothetical protein